MDRRTDRRTAYHGERIRAKHALCCLCQRWAPLRRARPQAPAHHLPLHGHACRGKRVAQAGGAAWQPRHGHPDGFHHHPQPRWVRSARGGVGFWAAQDAPGGLQAVGGGGRIPQCCVRGLLCRLESRACARVTSVVDDCWSARSCQGGGVMVRCVPAADYGLDPFRGGLCQRMCAVCPFVTVYGDTHDRVRCGTWSPMPRYRMHTCTVPSALAVVASPLLHTPAHVCGRPVACVRAGAAAQRGVQRAGQAAGASRYQALDREAALQEPYRRSLQSYRPGNDHGDGWRPTGRRSRLTARAQHSSLGDGGRQGGRRRCSRCRGRARQH